MKDIAVAWENQGHPALHLSFGASSTLARQTEQGAPANLFASACEHWVGYLAGRNLMAADTWRDLLSNRLVLIGPADHPRHVVGWLLLRSAQTDWRLADGVVRHPARVHHHRRQSGARRHAVSADGLGRTSVAGRRRFRTGASGAHIGSRVLDHPFSVTLRLAMPGILAATSASFAFDAPTPGTTVLFAAAGPLRPAECRIAIARTRHL
jgi:hypothetical protein